MATRLVLGRTAEIPRLGPRLTDIALFSAIFVLFYLFIRIGHTWVVEPLEPIRISLSLTALPGYLANSLLRLGLAYGLSLVFTIVYGYIAAYNRSAEKILIPLLDVLQSIPVLSFLPGAVLVMVGLFPHSRLGPELASIILIFTGQVWNMTFSFYNSLKSIPRELKEASRIYRMSWWQRLNELEAPYSAIGLAWNSMMSVAGGWFFLMVCEMFVLGQRDFRLPGLGSYLQTAASAGDVRAILYGVGTMIVAIVLLDILVWRPVIAWSDKFKLEQTEGDSHRSFVLRMMQRSSLLRWWRTTVTGPSREKLDLAFARPDTVAIRKKNRTWLTPVIGTIAALTLLVLVVRTTQFLSESLNAEELRSIGEGALATLTRTVVSLVLACAWTIPAGVMIGMNPRLVRIAQPVVQIAASIPATALFPVLLLILIQLGGGLTVGSVLLMMLGTQWYVLFNVIAGAMAIPSDLREAADVLRLSKADRWKQLILPGIFPYLVTGLVTATGGAWNASIVAEYIHFKGGILRTVGLGALISEASDRGAIDVLLASTILMSVIVVTINRLLWKRLYRIARTKYRLET